MIKDRNIADDAFISPHKIAGGSGMGNLFFLAGALRPGNDVQGQVYYVHDGVGSDNYDGLSPDKPYATISKARTVSAGRINWAASGVPWANNDMIVIYPGVYNESNLTGGLYGVHVVGLGNSFDVNGESGVVIKPASGVPWDAASWINGSLRNVCLMGASGANALLQLDTLNRFLLEDIVLQGIPGASPTNTFGLETTTDVTGSELRRIWVNQCATGMKFDVVAPKQFTGCRLEDIFIMGSTTAGIQVVTGSTPSGTVVKRFVIGPTPTLGINDPDGGVMFCDGHVEATANDPATGSGHYSNVYLNGTLQA